MLQINVVKKTNQQISSRWRAYRRAPVPEKATTAQQRSTLCFPPGLPRWHSDGESSCQSWDEETQVGRIPWNRKWQSTPVFLPGKFHGQRSLAGCSPWGHRVRHNRVTKHSRQSTLRRLYHQEQETPVLLQCPQGKTKVQNIRSPSSVHETKQEVLLFYQDILDTHWVWQGGHPFIWPRVPD